MGVICNDDHAPKRQYMLNFAISNRKGHSEIVQHLFDEIETGQVTIPVFELLYFRLVKQRAEKCDQRVIAVAAMTDEAGKAFTDYMFNTEHRFILDKRIRE